MYVISKIRSTHKYSLINLDIWDEFNLLSDNGCRTRAGFGAHARCASVRNRKMHACVHSDRVQPTTYNACSSEDLARVMSS